MTIEKMIIGSDEAKKMDTGNFVKELFHLYERYAKEPQQKRFMMHFALDEMIGNAIAYAKSGRKMSAPCTEFIAYHNDMVTIHAAQRGY